MSLKTFVKVSRVSNLSDARYCAGMMVDMLGFNLDETDPDFVSPTDYREITEWVAGVDFVGEFESSDVETIKLKAVDYNLNFIEVTDLEKLEELSELGKSLLFKLIVSQESDIDNLANMISVAEDFCEKIIIDCSDTSLFETLEKAANTIKSEKPLIKAYNVNEESVSGLAAKWSGIQLKGSHEDQPGFKDYGIVMDILEVLEED